jgi:hypothetical protein
MKSLLRFVPILALAALVALPASAQRADKIASSRGDVVPFAECTSAATLPCMSINPSPPTSNTVEFVNFGNGLENADWDLFMVPTSQGSVTFSSTLVGSFLCGTSFNPSQLSGFCTATGDSDAGSDQFLTSAPGPGANQLTFSFIPGAVNLPAEWIFFADAGTASIVSGSTATPEPPTVALVAGALLFALAKMKRLRLQS